MAHSDNHPDSKTKQRLHIGKNWRPIHLLCPAAKTLEWLRQPNMLTLIPFHFAQHGLRPKHPTCTALSNITANIAAGFSIKCRLSEQCSSRSIKQLHSTIWTSINCSIVSSTPTYRQKSIAGYANICRTDEPKFIFGKENLIAERC